MEDYFEKHSKTLNKFNELLEDYNSKLQIIDIENIENQLIDLELLNNLLDCNLNKNNKFLRNYCKYYNIKLQFNNMREFNNLMASFKEFEL